MAAAGAVVSAEQLLEQDWDEFADPFTSAVTVTVMRLRRKLGDPPLIETVVGAAGTGYHDRPSRPRKLSAGPRTLVRSSVRARIAVACAGLFLVVGGVLIAATYGIVGHISNHELAKIRLAALPSYQKLQTACQSAHANGTILQDPAFARKCRYELHTLVEQTAIRQRNSDRREFLAYSLAGLGVTTLLAGALGWAVAGRVLSPLRAITEAARAASQETWTSALP
jgi:hypothetical protein